jgi:putative membrane protein
MNPPFARPVPSGETIGVPARPPRAFSPAEARDVPDTVETLVDAEAADEAIARPPGLLGWLGRIAWISGSLLVSLALGLGAEALIRNLFATSPWLGWVGVAILALFVLAVVLLVIREAASVMRLASLEKLRRAATLALATDRPADGRHVVQRLSALYAGRPDLARQRTELAADAAHVFDGGEHIRLAERLLLAPLDARARALTAASARRVALVTAISPRALVDIAFVIFESVRLGGDVARLYGARPGFFGTVKLLGAILAHLAVTGGLVLTDGVVEQLVGQGLAARLSARLGEGVVNGLMTVRVGIAAMRVVRPLPYATQAAPMVKDFIPELANVLKQKE